jgi:hypothetical protein
MMNPAERSQMRLKLRLSPRLNRPSEAVETLTGVNLADSNPNPLLAKSRHAPR